MVVEALNHQTVKEFGIPQVLKLPNEKVAAVQTLSSKERRGLEFKDKHCPTPLIAISLNQAKQVIQTHEGKTVIETSALWSKIRQRLTTPQRLQLGPREIFRKPVDKLDVLNDFPTSAGSKLGPLCDIGRTRKCLLVSDHERTVRTRHEIRLKCIATLRERHAVADSRVLGSITRSTSMPNEYRSAMTLSKHASSLTSVNDASVTNR